MTITWLGHAAFRIQTTARGGDLTIICDPYSSRSGYDPINQSADVVTLSHDNPKYHSCLDDIEGTPFVVQGLEVVGHPVAVRGLDLGAVAVWEKWDAETRQGEGPNAMVWMQSEGLRVLHMGDVGHALSDDQIGACGSVDVLLACAGGPPTIELDDLKRFIDRLQPRLVIPMHFGTPKLDFKLQPVEDLANLFAPGQVRFESSSTITINRALLEETGELHLCVLKPAR